MSRKIFEKIQQKEKERQELLSRLFENEEMVRGSFCQIFVKCGRAACKCSTGIGHPHKRMSLRENGKNFSRAVPREDHDWIEEKTMNYRNYRLKRRLLTKLESEIKKLIDQHEESCLKKTKKRKPYLEVFEANPEPNCKKGSGKAKNGKS
jgi:uncharacterized protein DUF6788